MLLQRNGTSARLLPATQAGEVGRGRREGGRNEQKRKSNNNRHGGEGVCSPAASSLHFGFIPESWRNLGTKAHVPTDSTENSNKVKNFGSFLFPGKSN